ncbi:unnamed protein product, partial [Prorocentrum cordatum]
AAAKATSQNLEQIEGYATREQRSKDLRVEVQAAKPFATQADDIANRIQCLDCQISNLQATIVEAEAEITKQHNLLEEQRQQLLEKTIAREALQLEYMEMLESTVPPPVAGSPGQSGEAVVTVFNASLEQLRTVICQLGEFVQSLGQESSGTYEGVRNAAKRLLGNFQSLAKRQKKSGAAAS